MVGARADATSVRPQGGSLFLARADGHLAYGTTEARLERADFALDPETDFPNLDPADLLPAAFDTVGLAWSRDDAGLLVTVAHLHDSPEDANRNADALASVWSTTASPDGSAPGDPLAIEAIATLGRVASIQLRPADPTAANQLDQNLQFRGPQFLHADDAQE